MMDFGIRRMYRAARFAGAACLRVWRGFYYYRVSRWLGGRFYGQWFYEACAKDNLKSHPVIARTLVEAFPYFRRVVDFGCGDGLLLAEMKRLKRDASFQGFEFSPEGIRKARALGLDVTEFDFRRHCLPVECRADIVISIEVAEHLESRHADFYTECLSSTGAGKLIFTAAHPGQGGEGHYNEQPIGYWIDRFAKFGWVPENAMTSLLREAWKSGGVASYYWENLVVFDRP